MKLKSGYSYSQLPKHRHWLIDTYKLSEDKWIPQRFVIKATRSPEEAIRVSYAPSYCVSAPLQDARYLSACWEKKLDPLILCSCSAFFWA